MALWGKITDWWNGNADQLSFRYIAEGDILEADNAYFRLWLVDMFLAKAKQWGQNQWPAVHATVQLAYGDEDRARFTKVAQPPKELLGVGLRTNYQLTPLLPFSGGVVEIESALIELKGESPIHTAISVLADFSTLVGAPLSTALSVADKVADGVVRLADTAGGGIQLGLHQSLVAAGGNLDNTLRSGHIVVVNAPASSLNAAGLRVEDSRLHAADGKPLTGFDYLVFGVESRTTRDDYSSLFAAEFNAAKKAAIFNRKEEFEEKSKLLYLAVLTSTDLTEVDQQVQYTTYRKKLDEYWDTPPGAVPEDDSDDLDEIVKRASIVAAPTQPVTVSDVLGA